MTSVEHFEDSAEHEASEGEVMEGGESFRESLVVSGQSAEAGGPGEAEFHHPPARQQHETAFGLWVLYHRQLNAVLAGRVLGGFPGLALRDICKLHMCSR